ncbi:MAG: hypothetical protein JW883_12450 [Deltaproteobacteria bacterium]|nr:hypothetical protein [Deltaproteobacteria bacterium]
MPERDFVDSTKSTLMDNLLNSIEQRFDLTDQALVMPEELASYFDGRLTVTDDEKQRFHEAFNGWQTKAFDSLRRRRPTVETLTKFLHAMPEPLRVVLLLELKKRIGPQTRGAE